MRRDASSNLGGGRKAALLDGGLRPPVQHQNDNDAINSWISCALTHFDQRNPNHRIHSGLEEQIYC